KTFSTQKKGRRATDERKAPRPAMATARAIPCLCEDHSSRADPRPTPSRRGLFFPLGGRTLWHAPPPRAPHEGLATRRVPLRMGAARRPARPPAPAHPHVLEHRRPADRHEPPILYES